MERTIGLVGTGERFAALAALTASESNTVYHWDPDSADGQASAGPQVRSVGVGDMRDCAIIFLALPMHRVRPVARDLGDVLSGRHVLVHTVRNFEHATLEPVSQILADETPTQRLGFLTGPFRLADVEAGRPGSAVVASNFPEVQDLVEDVITTDAFRLYRSQDIVGAEVAGAFGRVLAVLCGIARQMAVGTSLEATLFARGLAEMSRFVVYRGGFEKTAFGLAGCGNLYAETVEPGSAEFNLGREFARRDGVEPEDLRAEFGVAANEVFNLLDSLRGILDHSGLHLPILDTAIKLADGRLDGRQALESLMTVPVFHE